MKKLMVFAALAALVATHANAANQPYVLNDVVVTDTKIAQPESQVTQQIDVVYAQEIGQQTTYNRNIAELLQYNSGIFVDVLSRNDANWGSFGGIGPKYNTYLLDGLPIDSFVDTMSLDPMALERVELHKGPASVMYSNYLTMDFAGNEAPLAGITNLITRNKIDAAATRILVGAGSWQTTNEQFYHQDRKGNFNYFFGANYEQSNYTNYGTNPSWLNIIKDPEYQKTKLYGKVTYLFDRDDHSLSIFANHTQHTGDAGRPNRDFDHLYDTINFIYANQITNALNLQVKTGYRNYDRRWGEDNFPDLSLREHDGVQQKIIPSDITLSYKHLGNSILTVGADYQVATYKTYAEVNGVRSTGNDVSANSTGAYLQEKYVLDKLVLRAGGRFNYTRETYDMISGAAPGIQNNSWNKFLWSVGARYNALPQLAVFANSGSSFVVPSAKSVGGTLLASDLDVVGKNGQLPNPNLKPENGIGSDLGFDLRPLETMKVTIRGFYNSIDDMILDNVVSNNPSQSQSINAGKATSYGVEVAVEHVLTDAFQWFANMTYTKSKVENPLDPDQDGTDITFVPDYVANVGITAKLPLDITVAPYLHMVGTYSDSTSKSSRTQFGPYNIVNMKLLKTLLKTADYTMTAAVDLNNITNKKYVMPWQFMDPGFNAFGSLDLTF